MMNAGAASNKKIRVDRNRTCLLQSLVNFATVKRAITIPVVMLVRLLHAHQKIVLHTVIRRDVFVWVTRSDLAFRH